MSAHRGPGRPRLVAGQDPERINVLLTPDLHDGACRVAVRSGVSVGAVIRMALARLLKDERLPPDFLHY